MFDLQAIKRRFADCSCGKEHTLGIKEAVIERGAVKGVGDALKRNGFGKKLLLVADENTLKAAHGIENSLKGFDIERRIYPDLREATLEEAQAVGDRLKVNDGVISVGTGSLNDICRKGAADADKPLCIFATAPSMDGFASYGAPLIHNCFKATYPAKTPEVIIADTQILAQSPAYLKSAGFGDMVGKYVGLIDWQVSSLLTGEYYCEKVADLTRVAADDIMSLADRITAEDEESAAAVFEALLLTGIGMSFVKTSRPASGTEHILSHFWESKKLLAGETSDFHGKKVGVATLLIMEEYEKLAQLTSVNAHPDRVDWQDVFAHYGALKDDVERLNFPKSITDDIDPRSIEENWGEIRRIIRSVPTREQISDAMKRAGCATTNAEIAVSDALKEEGLKYHPFMRARITLKRLTTMIN